MKNGNKHILTLIPDLMFGFVYEDYEVEKEMVEKYLGDV